MKYIKTYEGLFDLLKRKNTEDDDIALVYINRLKRVKGICPYDIEFVPDTNNTTFSITKYIIHFDDTPIKVFKILSNDGFCEESIKVLLAKGASRKSKRLYYALLIDCIDEKEKVFAKASILEELYNLCDNIYKIDKDIKRKENIRLNINPAADYLDPDIN